MKSKHKFSFGSLKTTQPSSYINHDKLDISSNCPTLKKIIDSADVKISDLPSLQIETEKIISNIGYRLKNIKSLIDGKPIKQENGLINQINNKSQYLQFIALPIDSNSEKLTENKIDDEIRVKTDSENPLTLIISQNRPKTRKSSFKIDNKRKLLPQESFEIDKKRQKSIGVKNSVREDNKPNYVIPNRFWELMEPYCAELSEESVRVLEQYVEGYGGDGKYYEIPNCVNNINNNIDNKRHNSDNNIDLNGFVNNNNKGCVELSSLLKKIDCEIRKPLSQTKALKSFPQTLVNKMSQESDELIELHKSKIKDLTNNIASEASYPSKTLSKQLKVSNSYKIEKHIKKSMEDLGMYNFNLPFIPSKLKLEQQLKSCNNDNGDGEDDGGISKSNEADIIDPVILGSAEEDYVELHLPTVNNNNNNHCRNGGGDSGSNSSKVLLGLRRRQAELRLVSESNLGMLRRLLVCARRDMRRQEVERRLAVADADVIDSYNMIESYRASRKPPLKKDRDVAFKSLKERQKILKELEAFDSEFL